MLGKRALYISTFLVGIFAMSISLLPNVSYSFFGYGYDCGGKFGYGYTCDSDGVSGSKVRQYKNYKERYKNKSAKVMYYKIKYLKKGTSEDVKRFEELRAIYKKYKNLSSNERRANLTPKEYAEFQAYQHYNGYKKYKELKKDID